MSIWVGARVRPFNGHEKFRKAERCVDIFKNTLILNNLVSEKNIQFEFDQCFNQGQNQQKNIDENIADQVRIYQSIGSKMIDLCLIGGANSCFMAYGPNASGKTFSTFGTEQSLGLVFRTGQNLFKRINEQTSSTCEYQVELQMFEIYIESVHDLFKHWKEMGKDNLKIREKKDNPGVFIEGLTIKSIHDYEELQANIQLALKNKAIGATAMSMLSARGHTFVHLHITKKQLKDNLEKITKSTMKFIDLAGSQKMAKTGMNPSVLKQVKQVNKSIMCMNKIIYQISQKEKDKKIFLPYRDSKLTRLIQNNLSGKQHTFYLFPVSPASCYYQQTLGSLRIAKFLQKFSKAVSPTKEEKNQIQGMKLIQEEKIENKSQSNA